MLFAFSCFFILSVAPAAAQDYNELLPIIKACADIPIYDEDDFDINELMLRVLYTHHNFQIITSISPKTNTSGALNMCNAEFIDHIMDKVFRLTSPKPTPVEFTKLNYYYNNGYYYYTGGYTSYYATDVKDIIKTIPLDDGDIYIIFENTYAEKGNSPVSEHSSIKFRKDDMGYFVTAIDMGLDYSILNEQLDTPSAVSDLMENLQQALPFFVIAITFTVALIVLIKFVLF